MLTQLTFTFGDPDAIDHAVDRLQGKYPMELNAPDFRTVLHALNYTWRNSEGEEADNAGDLLSSILSTLEIEYV